MVHWGWLLFPDGFWLWLGDGPQGHNRVFLGYAYSDSEVSQFPPVFRSDCVVHFIAASEFYKGIPMVVSWVGGYWDGDVFNDSVAAEDGIKFRFGDVHG